MLRIVITSMMLVAAWFPLNGQIEPESLLRLGMHGPVRSVVIRSQEGVDSLLFDRKGHLVEEYRTQLGPDSDSPSGTRFEYDSTGRLRRRIDLRETPNDGDVECLYDAQGRRVSEEHFLPTPVRHLADETIFTYAPEGHVEEVSLIRYASDGTWQDSRLQCRATFLSATPGEQGWVRSIAAGRNSQQSAEITYRDPSGRLRRRIIGPEEDPISLDQFDSGGHPISMFRYGSDGKPIAYYFVNDSLGNPLRRTMGSCRSFADFKEHAITMVSETEFTYTLDAHGNWTSRTERIPGAKASDRPLDSQTLSVERREITYW